ncbi:MAG: ParM/StbA family protein [Caldisericum sp.]
MRANQVKNYTIAVMDPGYGNFKFALVNLENNDYTENIQPSIISRVPSWEYEKLDGIGQSACVSWKGEKYLVGTLATIYGLTLPSLSKNWLTNLACPLFALSFCKGVEELYVMLSPSDWDQKPIIEQSLKEAGFDKIYFAAQGTGAWLDVGAPSNAVIIDIGFNTVDVFIVLNKTPIRELCFALKECGLVSFIEKLTKDDPILLARRLEEGDTFLSEKITKHYFSWLFEKLETRTEWRKKPSGLKIVIAGGGAYFIPEELKKQAIVPKNPVLANVKGLAKFILKKRKDSIKETTKEETTRKEITSETS